MERCSVKSKEQKRREAAERQRVYDALELWEKELLLAGRPGAARRERSRLGISG